MSELEILFASVFAFFVGYGFGHFAKNIGSMSTRWGILSIIGIPAIVLFLFGSAAMLTDLHNVIVSLALGIGFVLKMVRN